MTEGTCVVTSVRYPEFDHTGSVGRPLPNIDMKLVVPSGNWRFVIIGCANLDQGSSTTMVGTLPTTMSTANSACVVLAS